MGSALTIIHKPTVAWDQCPQGSDSCLADFKGKALLILELLLDVLTMIL